MSIGFQFGFYEAQVAFRNSNGYPMGVQTSPDAVSNGTTTHAYRITGGVSCTAPQASFNRNSARGGMKYYGAVVTGLNDIQGMTLTLAHFDPLLDSYLRGYTVDTTNGGTSNVLTAPNSFRGEPPQMILMLTRGYVSTTGTRKFITYGFSNVTFSPIEPGFSQDAGENTSPMAYTIELAPSTRTFYGMTLSSTSLVLEDNTEFYQRLETTYRVGLTTYVDDASATSFVVGYRPVTSDNDNTINVFLKNGANAASSVSGFSTTTGATTHTAGTAADIWTALYGTRFTAI